MKINVMPFVLFIHTIVVLSGCATSREPLTPAEIDGAIQAAERGQYNKLEEAQQSVSLALRYHDQGGYEKSAALFLQAADLYAELETKDELRKSLLAAAKMQLKYNEQEAFLLTMARYKGLLDVLEMPSSEERFLINLSNHMKGEPLTYPVERSKRVVFEN